MNGKIEIAHPLERGPRTGVFQVREAGGPNRVLVLSSRPRNETFDIFSLFRACPHPAFPKVVDVFESGSRIGIVCEKLEADGLDLMVDRLSDSEILQIAASIAEILEYLHKRRIYVGYLTPRKVFLTAGGPRLRVTILPQVLQARPPQPTEYSRHFCSPAYLDLGQASQSTDLHSYGRLLRYLLNRRRTNPKSLRAGMHSAPDDPQLLNPHLPPRVIDILKDLAGETPRQDLHAGKIAATLRNEGYPGGPLPFPLWNGKLGWREPTRRFISAVRQFSANPKPSAIVIRGHRGGGKSSFLEECSLILKQEKIHTVYFSKNAVSGAPNKKAQPELRKRRGEAPTEQSPLRWLRTRFEEGFREPVALLVDGPLHPELQNLLENADGRSSERPGLPILLVHTADRLTESGPESIQSADRWKPTLETDITLLPLNTEQIRALIHQATGTAPPQWVGDLIQARTGGNPRLAMEFLKAAVTRRQLRRSGASWTFTKNRRSLSAIAPPRKLVQEFCDRLKILTGTERSVLGAFSALRGPIDEKLLAAICGMHATRIENSIAGLIRAGFIEIEGTLEKAVYTFPQSWFSRALLDSLKKPEINRLSRSLLELLDARPPVEIYPRIPAEWWIELIRTAPERGLEHLNHALASLSQRGRLQRPARLLKKAWKHGFLEPENRPLFRSLILLAFRTGDHKSALKALNAYEFSLQEHDVEETGFCKLILGRIMIIKGDFVASRDIFADLANLARSKSMHLLHIEARCGLLASLSALGESTKSFQIKTLLEESINDPALANRKEKIFNALSLYYYQIEGDFSRYRYFASKAIDHALRDGRTTVAAGRIHNVTAFKIVNGDFGEVEPLLSYYELIGGQSGHSDLLFSAEVLRGTHSRKLGYHYDANDVLRSVFRKLDKVQVNRCVKAALLIELTKNHIHGLELASALKTASRCFEDLKTFSQIWPRTDLQLAHCWLCLQLGRTSGLERRIEKISRKRRQIRLPGRLDLLRGELHLRKNELERAAEAADAALASFRDRYPYYASRGLLLKTRILLAFGRREEAAETAEDALRTARSGFYFPFMAEAHGLKAQILLDAASLKQARAHALRGLQLCRSVDRPGLRAFLHRTLARAQLALGHPEAARDLLERALHPLRERLLRLPARYRPGFSRNFIEPLEAELLQVDSQSATTPELLSRIREFSDRLMEPRSPEVLAEKMVKTIGQSIPEISVRFFLRQRGGAFRQVARFGRLGRLDRKLLHGFQKTDDRSPCEAFAFPENPQALAYLLSPGPELSGLLYVEKKAAPVFSGESSFIAALGAMYCSTFSTFVPRLAKRDARADGLELSGGAILVGRHPLMQALFVKIRQAAATSVTVLIDGESGTGKELVAKGVHQLGARASRPFVPISCAALPEHLIESELFGYEKGSFTGADQRRIGLFEAAHGGTLFLDEISAMPLASQARLLRTIQEKSVRRIGETKERPVDVRIVAASNQDLGRLVRDGRFREDLYHRLNVFPIQVPPLRERLADIRSLALHFLARLNEGEATSKQLSRSALSYLEQHSYPGNVRELQNLVESLYCTTPGAVITARDVVERLPVNEGVLHGWQGRSSARAMLEELRQGRADFWADVRDGFLDRELSRREVRELIREGLKLTRGNYKELLRQFRLPAGDYKKFLAFLTNHRCKVDFRPYRRGPD